MAKKIFQILRNSNVYNDYTTAAAAFNVPVDVSGLIDGQLKSARYVDGDTEKAIIGIWDSDTNKWSMIDIESSLLHAVLNAKQINVTDPSSGETKALDEVIFENETVTAAALNDLNEKIKAIENANFGASIDNAISTAAEDASTKANAAKEAAIATAAEDASTKAKAAKEAAMVASAADATNKANNAKEAAIATAAEDASTKATAAKAASHVTLVHNDGTLIYTLYQGTDNNKSKIGNINIPKDMVVESGSVITATDNDHDNDSTVVVGEKYIKLVVTNVVKPLYIAVNDLYKDHTAAKDATEVQVAISNDNVISATIVNVDASKVTLKNQGTNLQDALTTINSTLTGKQDVIDGLDTIRSGAAAGATAVQPATLNNYYTKSDEPFKKTKYNGIQRKDYVFVNCMNGEGSMALGNNGGGEGYLAVTEGFGNIAGGDYSHAEGTETQALASCAHACGRGTIASGKNQFVIGQYNIEDTSSLFIIGNGTADEQHTEKANALTVDMQGNLWIAGNLQNDQMLKIEASISTLKADWIEFDQNILSPNSMISGDVGGNVLKWIRNNSHRFLGKYTADGKMTICQLDDSDGTKYKDGGNATLDGTQGDVFMRLPEFYTHFEQVTDKIFRVGFSRYDLGTGWKKWGGNELIGVYEATINANTNKLSSIAGNFTSTGSFSYQDFKAMATDRGNGYSLVKWKHQNIMAFLYYAFYGDTDCQTRIGSGDNSSDRKCGTANSLGMADGKVNGSISFWGLENWWGCKYEMIDDVSVNGMKWTITEDDNTVREVTNNIPVNDWQVATALIAGEHLDVIPSTVGGTTSTGFCDGIIIGDINNINNGFIVRSGVFSNLYGGVACETVYSNTTRNPNTGTRIAFKGSIVVVNDHDTFESISSIN